MLYQYVSPGKFILDDSKNISQCLGMSLITGGYPGNWISLQCDAVIYGSYFCEINATMVIGETNKTTLSNNPFIINNTKLSASGITAYEYKGKRYVLLCKKGWILIYKKCYRIITFQSGHLIKYQGVCKDDGQEPLLLTHFKFGRLSHYNWDQINITYMPRSKAHLYSTRWLDHIEHVHGAPLFVGENINLFLSIILQTLQFNVGHRKIEIIAMTDLPNVCAHLRCCETWWSFYTDIGKTLDGWRATRKPCVYSDWADTIICQMNPARHYIGHCAAGYFSCLDNSCILLAYVCDTHPDCRNLEDESKCQYENINHNFKSCDQQNASSMYLPVHAFCDFVGQCPFEQDEKQCKYLFRGRHDESTIHDMSKFQAMDGECFSDGTNYDLNHICLLKTHSHISGCKHGDHLKWCKNIGCSGMFKCESGPCIDIIFACDGVYDCPGGEDEMMCDNFHCAGMIKCRGEPRCVPPWQVCDGLFQCGHSVDDEIVCQECKSGCSCRSTGYIARCDEAGIANNHHLFIYWRSLFIHGGLKDIDLTIFQHMNNLILLDLSKGHMDFSSINSRPTKTINETAGVLFLNISDNRFSDLRLVRLLLVHQLKELDFSLNHLEYIYDFPHLLFIQLINLAENKIKYMIISFHKYVPSLVILNLRGNPIMHVHRELFIGLIYLSDVKTSTSILCCVVLSNITCSFVRKQCHGVVSYFGWYLFSFLGTFTCIVFSILLFSSCIFEIGTHRLSYISPINFNTVVTTISISITILLPTYLYDKQNVFPSTTWRQSRNCAMVSLTQFALIHIHIITYIFYFTFLNIKSLYPFKHQCRFLRFSSLVCAVFWLTFISLSLFINYLNLTVAQKITGDLCFFIRIIHLSPILFIFGYITVIIIGFILCITFFVICKRSLLSGVNTRKKALLNYTIIFAVQISLWMLCLFLCLPQVKLISALHHDIITIAVGCNIALTLCIISKQRSSILKKLIYTMLNRK